jgi:formylglycine-generating enzyme required for sulfatase activity
MEAFVAAGHEPSLEQCLQLLSEADLVVAIVGHCYGSEPDGFDKSYTWLECEHAQALGKEVIPFLVDPAFPWTGRKESTCLIEAIEKRMANTALLNDVNRKMERLESFREFLRSRAMVDTFSSPEDLRGKVGTALRAWRDRHRLFPSTRPVARPLADSTTYLKWLHAITKHIDIRGIHASGRLAHSFAIEEHYIPLTMSIVDETLIDPGEPRRVGLEESLSHYRLVIEGRAGSGKTTFLRRVAFALTTELQGSEKGTWPNLRAAFDNAIPFPVFLKIAKLIEYIDNSQKKPDRPGPNISDSSAWILEFICDQDESEGWNLGVEFFKRIFRYGPSILLLDGLDEAPSEDHRVRIARLFENACNTPNFQGCRLVVSTRPAAHRDLSFLAEFRVVRIEPLEDSETEQFLRHWCNAFSRDSTESAAVHLRELTIALQALRDRPELREMVRNPLMLTALAVVHWNEGRMPERRVDLYDSILRWLVRSRRDAATADERLELLQHLALEMYCQKQGRRVQFSRGLALDIISRLLSNGRATDSSRKRAGDFLFWEELESGILVIQGSDIKFLHLQFQEYLAAAAIAGRSDKSQERLLLAEGHLLLPEWFQVMVLLAGILRSQGKERVDGLFRILNEQAINATALSSRAWCVGVMGAMLRDLPGYSPPIDRGQLVNSVMGVFEDESLSFSIRLQAAEAIGALGDPRLADPEANWATIGEGEFWVGAQNKDPTLANYDEGAFSDEGPVHKVSLAAYQIAKYPVTVQDYQRFLKATNHPQPLMWDHQMLYPNRPVVGVVWLDALSYCQWAHVRLPTESEWEVAARGPSGRRYPWGDTPPRPDRANYDGAGPGHPTPVGMYPAGATPDGIHDLSGNVDEWVEDCYSEHYGQPTQQSVHVVRGGSSGGLRRYLRAADRGRSGPKYRGDFIGFRCVRGVPS